jgi:hypothetical protein
MRGRIFIALLVAASPSLALAGDVADAGAPSTSTQADASEASTYVAPDPSPLVAKDQWVFDLRWDKGDVYLVAVHPFSLPAPQATPRALGRFALELYEGRTLIERARFDFPMLGVPEPDGGVRFTRKLTTRIGVMFPQTKRGTLLELVDRATGQRWRLPWPPEAASTTMSPTDAGLDGKTTP